MKLTTVFIIAACLQVSARGYSQKVTLNQSNVPLQKVFEEIRKQTGYQFFYADEVMLTAKNVTVNIKKAGIEEVLDFCFKNQQLSYTISENTIIVKRKVIAPVIIAPEVNVPPPAAIPIKGKITDEKGQPLEGATILVKGTNNGVKSDANGNFSIDGEPASTLVISFVGFETTELKIGNQATVSVQMKPSIAIGEQIVVIGYGTTSRANLTTAISKVNPADVPGAGNSSVNQLLFGRAAGLQVSTQSAEPGGNINLSIRGRGYPLIVVDGVVVPNDVLEPRPGITELDGVKRGGLGNISPSDIESIEVLKDASAAIYGVAASNGVILITTKKGKAGRMNISYSGSHSVVKNMSYLQPLSPKDYMTYYNVFSKDVYDAPSPKFSATDIQNAGAGTDWLGQVLRAGSVDNHSININGGNDKVTYYLSGSYFNQVGTMQNSDLKRYSGKMNVSFVLSKFLKLNTNINASRNFYTNSTAGWQNGGSGTQGFGALQAALSYPTYLPIRDANGNYSQFAGTGNPVSLLRLNDKTTSSTIFSNFSLDIDLIPKILSAKLLYGNNFENASRNFYIPSDVFFGAIYQSRGSISNNQRQNQTMEATLAFKKSFGKIFDVNAVAGYGEYLYDDNGSGLTATDMLDATGTNNMGASPNRNSMTSYKNYEKKRSYFTRANFGILDRYLVSLVYRADGIDKFFPANKYASFPSASVGWKISSEKFMEKFTFINLLKIRASAGVTGLPIGSAAYGQYQASPDQAVFDNGATIYTPYYQTAIDQPNLKWQKTVNTNIGLDFSLFKNRISGSVDLFSDKITNLLTRRSTNQLSAIASAYDNGGSQVRKGVEFSLKSVNIATKDFNWDMILNVTHYNWNWESRYNNQDLQPYQQIKDPVNAIYVFQTNGILQTGETASAWQPAAAKMPGAPKFVDINGDKIIDFKDIVMYKYDPKMIYGFGNNLRYKKFDLGVFFYASFGAKDFNNSLQWANPQGIGGGSMGATVEAKNAWSSVNPSGTLPGGKFFESALGLPVTLDTYLSNKDFVRCRNISLGYTFKSAGLAKYFNNMRIFVDVQNPFIFTKYKGADPEVQASPTKGGPAPYPMATTYSFGLNVNF